MNMHVADVLAPPPPRSLADTGLSMVMLRDLLLKTMFRMNLEHVSDIARAMALPLPVAQELVDLARGQRLLEATGSLHAGTTGEIGYRLGDMGKARALDALAQSDYHGALPVPMDQYRAQVRRQSIRNVTITRAQLRLAMGHMVLNDALLDQLGPAVSSGRSILLYGPPGNGKSSLANGLRDALGERVFVPRAIEQSGQVIIVYDPAVHSHSEPLPDDQRGLRHAMARFDNRYVQCARPSVITGGELSLPMLDLAWHPATRTYQAPLQMKAAGGIFIVDDLGRQAASAQALINRWLVPLDLGHDILSLQTGEKVVVPFDTLVVFSTNVQPNALFDGAALRRIFFKIRIDGPGKEDFLQILTAAARKRQMPLDDAAVQYLLNQKYAAIGNVFVGYQPAFLIDQIIAICDFEGLPYRMAPDLIDRAWANMFVRDEGTAPQHPLAFR